MDRSCSTLACQNKAIWLCQCKKFFCSIHEQEHKSSHSNHRTSKAFINLKDSKRSKILQKVAKALENLRAHHSKNIKFIAKLQIALEKNLGSLVSQVNAASRYLSKVIEKLHNSETYGKCKVDEDLKKIEKISNLEVLNPNFDYETCVNSIMAEGKIKEVECILLKFNEEKSRKCAECSINEFDIERDCTHFLCFKCLESTNQCKSCTENGKPNYTEADFINKTLFCSFCASLSERARLSCGHLGCDICKVCNFCEIYPEESKSLIAKTSNPGIWNITDEGKTALPSIETGLKISREGIKSPQPIKVLRRLSVSPYREYKKSPNEMSKTSKMIPFHENTNKEFIKAIKCCPNTDTISKTNCSHCQCISFEFKSIYCSHKLCYPCFTQYKNNPNIKLENPCYCDRCLTLPPEYSKECGHRFCSSCAVSQCHICNLHKDPETCGICQNKTEVFLLPCGHFSCLDCFNQKLRCKACCNLICEFCNNKVTAVMISRSSCRLCTFCYENSKSYYLKKENCVNCGQLRKEKKRLGCDHEGCEFCIDVGNSCFKCVFKKKKLKDIKSSKQVCFKCKLVKGCYQLFCEHFICNTCIDYKILKNLNFCCVECCLSREKQCINCRKISKWDVIEEKKFLRKNCCNEFYCLYCLTRKTKIFGVRRPCRCVEH